MTAPTQENQAQDQKQNDKEMNFRKQEAMYQKMLAEKEARVKEMEDQLKQRQQQQHEDDDDDEPYVDKRKLNKTLAKFGEATKAETQSEIQKAVHMALQEERRQNWIKANPDFYDILGHAEKFAQTNPELAESILEMPETFERQKLVYKTIKSMGVHKPPEKQSTIQDKIDANRKSPYYQPSGVAPSPYGNSGDFSDIGQKNAYDKMKELQKRLRL